MADNTETTGALPDVGREQINDQQPFTNVILDPFALQVLKNNVIYPVTVKLSGAAPQTAGNFGNVFTAVRDYILIGVSEVHRVAGDDGGAVTVDIEKCGTGVAPGSGTVLLASALSLKTTANTPQFATLSTTISDLRITRGDRLVLKDTGVLATLEDVCITILLREL